MACGDGTALQASQIGQGVIRGQRAVHTIVAGLQGGPVATPGLSSLLAAGLWDLSTRPHTSFGEPQHH